VQQTVRAGAPAETFDRKPAGATPQGANEIGASGCKGAKTRVVSGVCGLDTPESRRYNPPTFRQAVSFLVGTARPRLDP
jgi:hypothetical protein